MISVIITAFNEGDEVARTIASVRENTLAEHEIILVDDASTDGSCVAGMADVLVRHDVSLGIVPSRLSGVAAASGDALAFLDAHQRVSKNCLVRCADIARERHAIVWPDVKGLEDKHWCGHGARMHVWSKGESDKGNSRVGLYGHKYIKKAPRDEISRCSMMVVPGYVMDRTAWEKCRLIRGMARWGASEPVLCVKAFFTDTDILHLCDGSLARHLFRPDNKIPYSAPWAIAKRNHALISRVCFERYTWRHFWRPTYRALKVERSVLDEIEANPEIEAQRKSFQKIKCRPDSEFWRGLLLKDVPPGVAT